MVDGERGRPDDELIARVAQVLRAPEPSDPTFGPRLLAALEREPGPPVAAVVDSTLSGWHWWIRPRSIRVSPLVGVALAAGIGGVALVSARYATQRALAAVRRESASAVTEVRLGAVPIRFALHSSAHSVAVVGDFNDWDARATPLVPVGTDEASGARVWAVVVPLDPGRHQYAFIVDGSSWVTDPTAPAARDDDFGQPNSTVTVGGST